jgi:hypothetical protein
VDVTWLYGPLQPASNRFASQQNSEPVSHLSKSSSFLGHVKKPILKKRSMSEAMLQRSISTSSLVAEAAEMAQKQRSPTVTLERRKPRPIIGRKTSDIPTASSLMSRTTSREPTDYFTSRSTSGLQTPFDGEKKHIRFAEKVEQCIAIETKDGDDDEDDFNHNPWASQNVRRRRGHDEAITEEQEEAIIEDLLRDQQKQQQSRQQDHRKTAFYDIEVQDRFSRCKRATAVTFPGVLEVE